MAEVVLRFIAGRQQGREFSLKSNGEIVIGRADDAGLLIPDDTVSRKHAILSVQNDEIVLFDCSKNGTYLNGRPMTGNVVLKEGDQIHIGRTILKLTVYRAPTPNWIPAVSARTVARQEAAPAGAALSVASAAPPTTRPVAAPVGTSTSEHFRGSIGDIALVDLLQLLITTRKTGKLVLRSRDMIGRIFLDKGQICHATFDDGETVNALKVLYRLLRWTDGTFELEPMDTQPVTRTIAETNDYLLLEAMHQVDEINNLGPQLLPLHAEIALADPLPSPLRSLAPGDLDFIQLVLRHRTVRGILDHCAGTDFEGYTYLKSLIGRGYLVVAES